MKTDLTPSLWRTCRVLANPRRLSLLRSICSEGPGSVSELAQRVKLPLEKASVHLRLLQARGLIRASRVGARVFYEARPDPLVRHATPLLQGMRRAVIKDSAADIRRVVTGFTHPRRQILVRCLADGPCDLDVLAARGRMSRSAAFRHLGKLERRGFVMHDADQIYTLLQPVSPIARRLLQIALKS